jgi:RNA polymerase sigma-70 factor (ECF subfamily)
LVEEDGRQSSRDFVRARVEALYERHKEQVFRLALRYGGGRRQWAEDVTHDVFVTLLETIGRLEHEDDLGGWFYRVTTRRCLSRLERERSRVRVLMRWMLGTTTSGERSDEVVATRQDLDAVAAAAFHWLAPKEQLAFAMHHLDGKTQAEIARILGHSKGYISKLITRAEKQIALRLKGGRP